ncbi:MAG: hypothetical protein MK101_06835 [Phycisphaerales bacterium]|nr:hypothetical protein [Phycisphaerales bacterium]
MGRLACTLLLILAVTSAHGSGVLQWGDVQIDATGTQAELFWQSDQMLAGFQFEPTGCVFMAANGGETEALGWQVHVVEHLVLAFAVDQEGMIPPLDAPLHLISVVVPEGTPQLELGGVIFADAGGNMIEVTGPGVLALEPTCGADLDQSGDVGVDDLLIVLAHWSAGSGGDTNGDGMTNVDDVLAIVSAWGPC